MRCGFFIVTALALAASARAQGFPPDQAARHMTVPPEFEVKLFASEPIVRQPVAIEFDDRGRMWVAQYLQYPNPAGLKRTSVDRFSRTKYDKVPDPPPRGPVGADRITILEDTDNDGRIDSSKDFVTGLNLSSGIAFGHGGVFVLQVPYLLFYPDKNGDDVPDSDPEVLLKGFGMEDAHSVANSLTWGPDGWLYGCQGSTVTSNIRGIEFQQGVWRYHPLSKKFELFCEGGGNSWGLDFDPHGNLIYSTNLSPYRMLHAVQGGYYWKSFGKHGALHNPYTYGYFEHVAHENFQGGHVTVGGIIYQGDSFPEKYRGKYIAGDLLDHKVLWHTLTPLGSSFTSAHGGILLDPHDTWFASTDVTMGPDGAVYVSDWCDARTAHPDPDAEWDRSNGRVYRIQSRDAKKFSPPDVSKLKSEELVTLLGNSNDWLVRKARRVLADRRDSSVIAPLRESVVGCSNEHLALESLWALYVSGGFDEELARRLLGHANPDIRFWTVRFLGDESIALPELTKLAGDEKDVRVRSQLASTAKRLPADQCLAIIEQLVANHDDTKDLHIPLLLWWAIEHHVIDGRERVLEFVTASPQPIVRDFLRPRVMRRYAAEGDLLACARLLHADASLLASLDQGMRESSKHDVAIPAELENELPALWKDDSKDPNTIVALARLKFPKAQARAESLAMDRSASPDLRVAMLGLLSADELTKLLDPAEPEVVRIGALGALPPSADSAIMDRFAATTGAVRAKAAEVLLSRKSSATALLRAIDAGKFPKDSVTLEQVRQVASYEDSELNAIVRKHWGAVKTATPEEKLADVRRFNNDLRAASGDAKAGQLIFTQACATCHRLYDTGGDVGPDLTHANRKDRDYLLVSTVDPSAVVRSEHLAYVIKTTDGQVLTGLIAEQTPASVTLKNANNQKTVVPREKISDMKESPMSLMPEGLLLPFKPQQLRDLFAYLQSEKKP